MTIMLGIHQHQDKVDKLYQSMGIHAGTLTAVGPFGSKEDALFWQQELIERITDCAVIDPAGPEDEHLPWHGFSFEK